MFNAICLGYTLKHSSLQTEGKLPCNQTTGKTAALVLDLLAVLFVAGVGSFLMVHGGTNTLSLFIPGALLQGLAFVYTLAALVLRTCNRPKKSISIALDKEDVSPKKTTHNIHSDNPQQKAPLKKDNASTSKEHDTTLKRSLQREEDVVDDVDNNKPSFDIDSEKLVEEFRLLAEHVLMDVYSNSGQKMDALMEEVLSKVRVKGICEEERKERAICCMVAFQLMATKHSRNLQFQAHAGALDCMVRDVMVKGVTQPTLGEVMAEVQRRVRASPDYQTHAKIVEESLGSIYEGTFGEDMPNPFATMRGAEGSSGGGEGPPDCAQQ